MTQPTDVLDDLDRVTWWELPVRDLDRAKDFYGAVFGWTFAPFGDGYSAVHARGQMIGGLFEQPEAGGERGVRVYVNVSDIEATLSRVRDAGGEVRHDRTEVGGDMGWWADFTDVDGLLLGVCSSLPAE